MSSALAGYFVSALIRTVASLLGSLSSLSVAACFRRSWVHLRFMPSPEHRFLSSGKGTNFALTLFSLGIAS